LKDKILDLPTECDRMSVKWSKKTMPDYDTRDKDGKRIELGYDETFFIKGGWDIENQNFSYWSNQDGWVDMNSATIFNSWELNQINFPIGSTGIALIDDHKELRIAKQISITELSS